MVRIYYKTHAEIGGPWLLNREALRLLDSTFDAVDVMLKTAEGAHQAPKFPPDTRKVVVTFDSGKTVTDETLAGVERIHPEAEGGTAKSFAYTVVRNAVTAKVMATDDGDLKVSIEPEWAASATDAFGRLREWIDEVRLPLRDRLYERYGGWLVVLGLVLLVTSNSAPSSESYYKAQARELVAKGISEADIPKALQVSLAIAGGSPAPVRGEIPVWAVVAALCCLVLGLYTVVSPKLAIGLGSGQRKIAAWSQLRRILIYVLPGAALAAYVFPKIGKLLGAG